MYTTPHSKIFFLQTRAGKLLALGLMLSSGVANGLIMDLVFERTQLMGLAMIIFFLVLMAKVYLLSRFKRTLARRVYLIIGFYVFLIAFDRVIRQINTNTAYFMGFSIIIYLGYLYLAISGTEKHSRIVLDQKVFFIHACNAYNSKDFKSAIANFTDSIRSGNESLKAFYMRGMSYAHNGQLVQALDDFNRVIAIDPSFATVYYWRGLTYKFLNDERAAADLERFLADCDDEELKDHAQHHLQALQQAQQPPTG